MSLTCSTFAAKKDRFFFCLFDKTLRPFVNGFEKSKNFTTYKLIPFSPDTPQSIKRQNKGPKENDEKNIDPVVDRNRPIRKTQAQDRYS